MTGMSSSISRLIMRVASKPSITGILKSIKIKSYIPGEASRSISIASLPFSARAAQQSNAFSIIRKSFAAASVSSTSKTDILLVSVSALPQTISFVPGTFTRSSSLWLHARLWCALSAAAEDCKSLSVIFSVGCLGALFAFLTAFTALIDFIKDSLSFKLFLRWGVVTDFVPEKLRVYSSAFFRTLEDVLPFSAKTAELVTRPRNLETSIISFSCFLFNGFE